MRRCVVVEARRLDASQVDAIWRLRRSFMDVAAGVSEAEDRASFARSLRSRGLCFLEQDPDGRVRSSAVCSRGIVHRRAERVHWLNIEYVYTDVPDRSVPACLLFVAAWVIACRLTRPIGRVVVAGPQYLPSFLSSLDGVADFLTATQTGLSDTQRGLVHALAEAICGPAWRPESGFVHLNTRPRTAGKRSPRRASTRALMARYLAENPRWSEGTCLFVVVPVHARLVRDIVAQAATRLLLRPFRGWRAGSKAHGGGLDRALR